MMYGDGGEIDTIKNLTEVTSTVSDFTGTTLTTKSYTYTVSPNVKVYKYNSTNDTYSYEKLNDAVSAYKAGDIVNYYVDRSVAFGGQIRVIIYQ